MYVKMSKPLFQFGFGAKKEKLPVAKRKGKEELKKEHDKNRNRVFCENLKEDFD